MSSSSSSYKARTAEGDCIDVDVVDVCSEINVDKSEIMSSTIRCKNNKDSAVFDRANLCLKLLYL